MVVLLCFAGTIMETKALELRRVVWRVIITPSLVPTVSLLSRPCCFQLESHAH
jgi:hypothetical protein